MASLSIELAFLLLLQFNCVFISSAGAPTLLNFNTFVGTATDILEEGGLFLREQSDPLQRELEDFQHQQHQPRVVISSENFLVPLLSGYVGFNNQLMEYMTAAVIARATNRTLCLTPFFGGPTKHAENQPHARNSLLFEDHYDPNLLSSFVNVSPLQRCLKVCNKRIDGLLFLRGTRKPIIRAWNSSADIHDLKFSFVKWTSAKDVAEAFDLFRERCLALGGLFPGLRWRGAFIAFSAFLRPTELISSATTALQEKAIGLNKTFLAVHWRFEESNCRGHQLGLCFLRCEDGSIVDSGLHPAAREWVELNRKRCPSRLTGVLVTKDDLISAIHDRASKNKLDTVYLATDGWMRGEDAKSLIMEVVNQLRKSGIPIVGLWKIKGLPNFSDGSYFDFSTLPGAGSNSLSLIEQELCGRAAAFLGSGQSTWSLNVFRTRLAQTRSRQMRRALEGENLGKREVDDRVIEGLLGDEHAAGLQCRYEAFFRRARVEATRETYLEEAPDGWLDLEACERRIGRGGRCKIATCF